MSLLNPLQSNSVGPIERRRAWLEFTAWRLPELTQLSHVACFDMDVIDSKITTDAVRREMLSLCPCTLCRGAVNLDATHWGEPTTMCLFQVGITILEFIYTLSWLDIDDALQPSIDGLRARRPIKSVAIKPLPQLELLVKVSQLDISFLTNQLIKKSLIND
jgi:hypothetical protein